MLHIDPKMLGRLNEIETDLHTRRTRAEGEGWLGELEGIDLTSPSSTANVLTRNASASCHQAL